MTKELGVWTADDCALVLIDYQTEMVEVIRSETNADLVELHARLLAKTAKAFGVPIVLSTVGVGYGFNGPTVPSLLSELGGEDITDEEWDRDRREEVDLVFYLTRAAWPHLKAGHGVVVNMASLNASLSFKLLPSLAHTTSKAGIIGMTRQLAMEGREHGIRAKLPCCNVFRLRDGLIAEYRSYIDAAPVYAEG